MLTLVLTALLWLTACSPELPGTAYPASATGSDATAAVPVEPTAGPEPTIEEEQEPTEAQPERYAATPEPELSLECPEPFTSETASLRIELGYEYEYSTSTARVHIDYGDGKSYSTKEPRHIDSAFWHDYEEPGFFSVSATLWDGEGASASAECSFLYLQRPEPLELAAGERWSSATDREAGSNYEFDAPDFGSIGEPGTGSLGLCRDGSLTSAVGRQGACSWHGGLSEGSKALSSSRDRLSSSGGSTYVQPYRRSDGTYVSGHYRRAR